MNRVKRLLSLVLLLALLPLQGALAEFSPRLTELLQGGIQIEAGVSFGDLSQVSDQSLGILNDWLSRIRVQLAGEEQPDRRITNARVLMDQKEVFGVKTLEMGAAASTLSLFTPAGGAYLTGQGEKSPLALMAGEGITPPSLTIAADIYLAWAPGLYQLLEELVDGKASKTSTSIKNSDASQSYINYVFKADQMNAAWPQILSTLLPVLKEQLAAQPGWYQQAEALLSRLVFSGECRFKRFLNKQGGDMGLQFTGNAGVGDDVRKVTLFGGYTPDKGGYVSLALPAVKGKNNFKVTFTGKLTQKSAQNTLTLEGSYTRTRDGKTQTASLEGTLRNALKNGNEAWSGKMTLTSKQDGDTNTYTLTPDLTFTDQGLQGEMAIQHKQGSKTMLKCAVSLVMQRVSGLEAPIAIAVKDLRGMEESRARAIAMGEIVPLTGALMQLLGALPEESRALLTHELRTDTWMTGPVPPLSGGMPEDGGQASQTPPQEDQGPWIVEDEDANDLFQGTDPWIVVD